MFCDMDKKEHFHRLNKYFEKSKLGYNLLLGGSKHFGFYPKEKDITEKEAQIFLQELVGDKLNLSSSNIVLDAGCGQGVVSTFLARKYDCHIEGITMLPFEVDEANILARKLNINKNVNYSLMDYNEMTFQDDFFDAVYTTESLSHSTDIRATLKEFYRVLKDEGRIALFEYTIAEDGQFTASELKIINKVALGSAMDALRDFRHDEFQKILEEAGFGNIKIENISENTAPSLGRLRKFLIIPYYLFVKPFGLQERFPNASAGVEFYKMAKKGLIRYNIFTASKSREIPQKQSR
jgi:cyclopropane fatty-acyl-phospholipid synthase-like methyltransferase